MVSVIVIVIVVKLKEREESPREVECELISGHARLVSTPSRRETGRVLRERFILNATKSTTFSLWALPLHSRRRCRSTSHLAVSAPPNHKRQQVSSIENSESLNRLVQIAKISPLITGSTPVTLLRPSIQYCRVRPSRRP